MYVVKYKNNVILGIIPWNSQYIKDVVRVRYRAIVDIPAQEPDISTLPLQINDDLVIFPAEEDRPQTMNPLVEQYYGPLWEFLDNKVIAHYEVRQLDLDSAKYNYKAVAAKLRYDREISGTTVEINNITHKIETTREIRSKYIERLVSMSDTQTINFKFNQGWVELTKNDILSIVNAIDNHVQSAFNYEYNLSLLIDQATSIQDLLAIEELNKPENQPRT